MIISILVNKSNGFLATFVFIVGAQWWYLFLNEFIVGHDLPAIMYTAGIYCCDVQQ